jgi:hypothetical protein
VTQTHADQFKDKGLLPKYHVTKTDGSPVDPGAEYFCLRLDWGGSDPIHIAACRAAVRCYAEQIQNHLPALAQDLLQRYPDPKVEEYQMLLASGLSDYEARETVWPRNP